MLRVNGEEVSISEGDYAAFPASVEGAHQLVNTSDKTLRYLCLSSMAQPDAMVYPDSGELREYPRGNKRPAHSTGVPSEQLRLSR